MLMMHSQQQEQHVLKQVGLRQRRCLVSAAARLAPRWRRAPLT